MIDLFVLDFVAIESRNNIRAFFSKHFCRLGRLELDFRCDARKRKCSSVDDFNCNLRKEERNVQEVKHKEEGRRKEGRLSE